MKEKKSKGGVSGFWRRNWLSLGPIGVLSWLEYHYWHPFMELSPFLIIVLSFFLYLAVVKFFYDNSPACESLFTEIREGGWLLIKVVARPGIVIWQKCGAGMDLLTQRMGVEQELIIAEKRRKKLEIELLHRHLHEQLAQMPVVPPDAPSLPEEPVRGVLDGEPVMQETAPAERLPPYAKYAPLLMEYLEEVRWERFTVTQAQQILHKRFGTVKLVLEELVHQQKLEYVTTGKRVAYRPVTHKNYK